MSYDASDFQQDVFNALIMGGAIPASSDPQDSREAAELVLPVIHRYFPNEGAITNEQRTAAGLLHLIAARELFKAADAHRTATRVRSAISSAKGAERHAINEPSRIERGARKQKRAPR